jgi:hypothetical protein
VVVDISNPASPVIRGSVVSSSLMSQVREALSCVRCCVGRRVAPCRASTITLAPAHLRRWFLLTRMLSHRLHTASSRRRQRLARLRGGLCLRLAGGGASGPAQAAAALSATAISFSAGLHLRTKRRLVGGWARSVPGSRRRSCKHPQRRGERRRVGRRPSIQHLCLDRCE